MKELNELKTIVLQEQGYYDKNDIGANWGYYNAYKLVLKEIDTLLKETK